MVALRVKRGRFKSGAIDRLLRVLLVPLSDEERARDENASLTAVRMRVARVGFGGGKEVGKALGRGFAGVEGGMTRGRRGMGGRPSARRRSIRVGGRMAFQKAGLRTKASICTVHFRKSALI